jgi:hypothetical protein
MSSRSAMIRACSACGGDYEDPDRTAATDPEGDDMIVDDHETGASELVADGEDEAGGEVDGRPISARQAVKDTDPLAD